MGSGMDMDTQILRIETHVESQFIFKDLVVEVPRSTAQRDFATRRIMHYVIPNYPHLPNISTRSSEVSLPPTPHALHTPTPPILPRTPIPTMPSPPLSKAKRMSYRIGRGETGVLTFEPYKSEILPLWRFKTPDIARKSSQDIYAKFQEYGKEGNGGEGDFIGMDMCRKFLQMGMTRSKRYANHAGGRKYDKATGEELEKSKGHKGMEEKLEASAIFREVWEKAKADERYLELKQKFQKEQKEWDKEQRIIKKDGGDVESLVGMEGEGKEGKGGKTRAKKEIKEEEED